jgi:hypothetical protein
MSTGGDIMRTKHLVWALLLTVFAGGVSWAQTPPVIRFRAQVLDDAGQPAMGVVTLAFALYSKAEGGVALWSEVQSAALDGEGRYAVVLGSTRAEGLPLELFATSEARWLGVTREGREEQARVMLVSVPYALKAADAETIAGKPLSAFVLTGQTSGTGRTA